MVAGLGLMTLTSIVAVKGRINARLESVWGQIGERENTSAVGNTTAPPEAREEGEKPDGTERRRQTRVRGRAGAKPAGGRGVRNRRQRRLTPRGGAREPAISRATRSIVPSPP